MRVILNDVAEEVRGNWEGSTTGVPVVGLEHLDPDDIWLRRWEVDPDENTFTKAFKKGQILFGRRRAYQKKLSLTPCEGICSGDITVIAAKPEKVLPELLPFYLRTDAFFDYAVRGSGGSLSPRVKWSHISNYELDLPPLAEQKKLAELLWAANDLKEAYKKMIAATDEMLKAKFREMFGENDECRMMNDELGEEVQGKICEDLRGSAVGAVEDGSEPQIAADCRRSGEDAQGNICEDLRGSAVGAVEDGSEPQIAADCRRSGEESHAEMRRGGEDSHAVPQRRRVAMWPTVSLVTVCKKSGEYGMAASADTYDDAKGRYIRITDITDDGSLNDDKVSPSFCDEKCRLRKDDILFARTGNTVGKTYIHKSGFCTFAGYLIRYVTKPEVMNPDYLFAFTHTDGYLKWVENTKKIGAQPNISAAQYDKMPIPLPPLALQQEFVEIARKAEEAKAALKKSIADVEQVIRGLVNSEK